MTSKFGQLLTIVVAGVIVADLVANRNSGGTAALIDGIRKLWQIGINPTETKGL